MESGRNSKGNQKSLEPARPIIFKISGEAISQQRDGVVSRSTQQQQEFLATVTVDAKVEVKVEVVEGVE